jgi:uncharacterized protein
MPQFELPQAEIERLCRRFKVRRLWLVGSATGRGSRAGGEYNPGRSDLDFLVDFGPDPFPGRADCFFGLESALRKATGEPVDLIELGAVTNPFIRASMEEQRIPLYAAA